MPTLYHFPKSPFSRRARLCFGFKSVEVALRDARGNPAYLAEARALSPLGTMPVLVDDDGTVLGDSGAIARWLDLRSPGAPGLFPLEGPAARDTLVLTTLVDGAIVPLADLGSRLNPLRDASEWKAVSGARVGRAQGALNALATHVTKRGLGPLTDAGFAAADVWLYTAVTWLEELPGRAATEPHVVPLVELAWTVPAPLARWAEAHRERADVRALG